MSTDGSTPSGLAAVLRAPQDFPLDAQLSRSAAGAAAALFWVLAGLTACQQKGPTARELFAMRSECAVLANSWEKSQESDGGYTYSVVSHYDPPTNRCLMWVRETGDVAEHVLLMDAQSH